MDWTDIEMGLSAGGNEDHALFVRVEIERLRKIAQSAKALIAHMGWEGEANMKDREVIELRESLLAWMDGAPNVRILEPCKVE